MKDWIRAIAVAIAIKLHFSNHRPEEPQEYRDSSESRETAHHNGNDPETDVLRAEWAAFQTLIREIHKADKEHQATERNLGIAQHRTAKGLNWITAIGAIFGAVGSVGIIGSLIIAKEAADDARDALHQSQRPWIIAEKIEAFELSKDNDIYCRVGYRVFVRNTGNSTAPALIFDSRAVRFPPTWDWLVARVDDLREGTIKLWSSKRPAGLPVGIALAPAQLISPIRCPAFPDGNDPTNDQIRIGAFLVIGYMQYIDQYGLPHHTRFAFTPDSDSVRPWDGKTYAIYNDYQDAN